MISNKLLKVIRYILIILVITWFVTLFYFSEQTGEDSGKLSRSIAGEIIDIKDDISFNFNKIKKKIFNIFTKEKNIDVQNDKTYDIINDAKKIEKLRNARILKWDKVLRKCAHFSLFFVGGFLFYMLYLSFDSFFEFSVKRFIKSLTSTCVVAMFDEIHQTFSLERSPEIKDVIIDSLGGISGIIVASIIVWLLVKIVDYIISLKANKEKKIRS